LSPEKQLEIYNLKGEKIRQLSIRENCSSVIWNAKDEKGRPVSSGIYFYRLSSDYPGKVKKMILKRD